MNNQNYVMAPIEVNFIRHSFFADYDADRFDEEKFKATPYRFTTFGRIFLPVYQHAVKASASTGLYIVDTTEATSSLMGDKFKDISDFWEVQEAFIKVYLTGIANLIKMDRNQLSKRFATMSDADFGLMLVAFEKARKHFFISGKPCCLIFSDVKAAFALLSDSALELIYNYTRKM